MSNQQTGSAFNDVPPVNTAARPRRTAATSRPETAAAPQVPSRRTPSPTRQPAMVENQEFTKTSWVVKVAALGFMLMALVISAGVGIWVKYVPDQLPPIKGLDAGAYNPKKMTILTDDTGKVEIWDLYDSKGGRRLMVSPEQVGKAKNLVNSFVRAEDNDFFAKRTLLAKVKPKLRAAINTAKLWTKAWLNGKKLPRPEGGSSITEQVVKNLSDNKTRNLANKFGQFQKAEELEQKLDKTTILWIYFNEVAMPKGRIGVGEGARFLFGKEIENLTSAEAATVASLAKSPEYYNDIPRLKKRRNWILSRLKDAGDISGEEYRSGAESPIVFLNHEARIDLCPEYVKVITEFLAKEQNLKGEALFHAGLRVRTTCNIPMQEAARKAMTEQVKKIKDADGSTICIDPNTREVTCMVAVGDFHPTKVNREPGSSFKAHTWAAAYAAGQTPDTMVDDSPLTVAYKIPGSTPWQPGNHDNKYAGQINLRMAMAVSSNVVAARMSGESPGVESIRGMAEQAGIESDLQITDKKSGKKATPLSLAIGGMAVTPLEQANSYATYASGNVGNPIFVKGIRKGSGEEQELKSGLRNAGISQEILGMVTYTLQGVIELPEGTAHSTLSGKFGEWKVVGKTGTTNSSRDAWFVGYTPNMVCLSWIGARGKSLGKHVYGGNSAAHAWLAPMQVATKGKAPQPFPYPLYQPGQPPAPVATTPVVAAPDAPATESATPSAPTEEQPADKTSSTEDDD